MKPLRPRLRGLVFKLAVFYMLLSLPSLLLVESTTLIFEFKRFMSGVDGGSLQRAAAQAARELDDVWPNLGIDETDTLSAWSEALVLRLQRPRDGLIDASYVLMELAPEPLAAAVFDPDGTIIAQFPAAAREPSRLPRPAAADLATAASGTVAIALPGADGDTVVRRVLMPVRRSDGSLRGLLYLELRLPVPWQTLLIDVSFEWPIVFGYLVVFGLASSLFLATWVTRRLNRVAKAARAWSGGDFSQPIGDRSGDELGHVSALLDRMALELQALIRSRAQLATLAERQRLARDLHDTVKQKAFAMNLQLATARRQLGDHAASDRIIQAERLSQQIQRDLAQILDELRASDAGLPFAERLRMRALEWAQVSQVTLTLDIADAAALPADHEDALLRIVDEALANVLRHSGADQVAISLQRDALGLRLRIADNGCGMSADAQPGMGLANMRERANSLPGGRFSLDSRAGDGVTIHIATTLYDAGPP